MLAAVIERPGAVTVREVPAPQAAGLALVRVGVAGICGTDRKLAAGVFPVTAPRVLGHEMTGLVEVPAPGGTVPAGTAVVVNPAVFCGMCRQCRGDRNNARGELAVGAAHARLDHPDQGQPSGLRVRGLPDHHGTGSLDHRCQHGAMLAWTMDQ